VSQLETVGGDIRIDAAAGLQITRAASVGGHMTAVSGAGLGIEWMSNIQGDIAVSAVGDATVRRIENSQGTIDLDASSLTLVSRGHITDVHGSISITLRDHLSTMKGSVVSTVSGDINVVAQGDSFVSRMLSDSGNVSLVLGGQALLSSISTQSGDIAVNAAAGVKVLFMDSQSGDIRLASGATAEIHRIDAFSGNISVSAVDDVRFDRSDSGLQVHQGTGTLEIAAGDDVVMSEHQTLQTDAGTITVSAGGEVLVGHMASATGDIAVQAQHSVSVTGHYGAPQIVTAGDLFVSAGTGIGADLFGRLFVDVNSLSVQNGDAGDVVISGWKGLNIASAQSGSDNGWMVLMSGPAGRVTGNTPTAEGGRVARISGKTIISREVMPARDMYNANVFYTPPPAVHDSVNEDSLDIFNAQLARDWTQQVQGASAREALSARVPSLSSQPRSFGRALGAGGAFGDSPMDTSGSLHDTATLLDAALRMSSTLPREDVFGGDMLSSWAQRSFTERQAAHANTEPSANVSTPDSPAPVSSPSSKAAIPDPVQEVAAVQLKQMPTEAQVLSNKTESVRAKAWVSKEPESEQGKPVMGLKKSDKPMSDFDPQVQSGIVKPANTAEQAFAEASLDGVQPAASATETPAADQGSGAAS
jgi:hypothetical protein